MKICKIYGILYIKMIKVLLNLIISLIYFSTAEALILSDNFFGTGVMPQWQLQQDDFTPPQKIPLPEPPESLEDQITASLAIIERQTEQSYSDEERLNALLKLKEIIIGAPSRLREIVIEPLMEIAVDKSEKNIIRFEALSILIYIVKDDGIYPGKKEKIFQPLLKIGIDKENGDNLREKALSILMWLARDRRISPTLKEISIEPLLELVINVSDEAVVRRNTLGVLTWVVDDPQVNPKLKEMMVFPLLSLVTNKMEFLEIRFEAFGVLEGIVDSVWVNHEFKERMISSLLQLGLDEREETSLREEAFWVLGDIAQDPQVSPEKKEEIINPLLDLIGDKTEEVFLRSKVLRVLWLVGNDYGVKFEEKERIVELFLDILQDEAEDVKIWRNALSGLGYIAQGSEITELKERMIAPLLTMMKRRDKPIGFMIDSIGILWGIIAEDPQVSPESKEWIKSEIEQNFIDSKNLWFWESFGILILQIDRDLDSREYYAIYKVVNLLPRDKLPSVISLLENPAAPPGAYRFQSRVIEIYEPGKLSALFHEIGHYIQYSQFSFEQDLEWQKLFDASERLEDFAEDYGMKSEKEDFATMFEAYILDTMVLLDRAVKNISNQGNDVLLKKVEFIAKLFSQNITLDDGRTIKATYIYKVNEHGEIIRKTVILTEQEIYGRTYLLPDPTFEISYDIL